MMAAPGTRTRRAGLVGVALTAAELVLSLKELSAETW